jgi:hypothetical protein
MCSLEEEDEGRSSSSFFFFYSFFLLASVSLTFSTVSNTPTAAAEQNLGFFFFLHVKNKGRRRSY